jgi:hypothetical protein
LRPLELPRRQAGLEREQLGGQLQLKAKKPNAEISLIKSFIPNET